jgi:hypothetical protein
LTELGSDKIILNGGPSAESSSIKSSKKKSAKGKKDKATAEVNSFPFGGPHDGSIILDLPLISRMFVLV